MEIQNLKFKNRNSKTEIQKSKFKNRNLKTEIQKIYSKIAIQKPTFEIQEKISRKTS